MSYRSPGERKRIDQENARRSAEEYSIHLEASQRHSLLRIKNALGFLATQGAHGTNWMEVVRPISKVEAIFTNSDALIDGIRLGKKGRYYEHPAYWKAVGKQEIWLFPHVYAYEQASTHPRDEGRSSTCYESYAIGNFNVARTLLTHQSYGNPCDGRSATMDGDILVVAEHSLEPHSSLSPGAAEAIANALERIKSI
jgi:hypothetical protein